jgi:hypothetical protein
MPFCGSHVKIQTNLIRVRQDEQVCVCENDVILRHKEAWVMPSGVACAQKKYTLIGQGGNTARSTWLNGVDVKENNSSLDQRRANVS